MATRMFLIICLLYVGLTRAEDIDFGDPNTCTLQNKECQVDLKVDCQSELSGFIQTPNFPNNMISSQSGKYRLTISSCENSQITLILTDEDFFLGPDANTFSVGNGLVIGANNIPPELSGSSDGGNELPNGDPTYEYESASNELWMEANLLAYRSNFKIQYNITVLTSNIHNYNETSGNMTSPGYGISYPSQTTEDIHVIDVTDVAGEYVDLLLTVNVLDIAGINGDYIKLGPGSEPSVDKSAVVLSWRVNKGVQFLIDGPKAHLVFNVLRPADAEQVSAKGFFISYQVIEKNLTTAAPMTTPMPTSPTPLPFDPDILLTDVVYHTYVGAEASSQLAEILQMYAESSGMLEKGEIVPNLTAVGTVQIVQVENCYHGWNVDMDICGLTHVIVRAFYQKTGETDVTYAFPTEEVKKAVREYGYIHEVVLPEDLANLYWIFVGVVLILIILILLGLLIAWRQKMRRDAKKRRKYHEIKNDNHSVGADSDISITGVGKSSRFEMNSGVDNPNFVIDEQENGRPVMVYDPEKGTFYSRNSHRPTYQEKNVDQGPARSAAVLNVSPITSSFQRQNGINRDQIANEGNDMSSIMPPLPAVPKRGILKTKSNSSPTNREFPNISSIPMEEMEDVVFDNDTFKNMQQRRYSPASSSSDTITSSSRIGSHVLYGITLTDFDSEEEIETNF
ncbi:uncharacterized protein LOC124343181 isoform X2 [Daphnia pulicaria]|uniref:uncharacterized protein LOC124343181 isoform X2 n=1 Tax=Daphnia pulicaria TaxID=35523 RepID=UPI001EE9CFF3|nr:uncharacterized protein LOC124343181 isoform X2 [Daphnia pulicaria]